MTDKTKPILYAIFAALLLTLSGCQKAAEVDEGETEVAKSTKESSATDRERLRKWRTILVRANRLIQQAEIIVVQCRMAASNSGALVERIKWQRELRTDDKAIEAQEAEAIKAHSQIIEEVKKSNASYSKLLIILKSHLGKIKNLEELRDCGLSHDTKKAAEEIERRKRFFLGNGDEVFVSLR